MRKSIFLKEIFQLLNEYENEGMEKSQDDYWTSTSYSLDTESYNVGVDILNMTIFIKYKLSLLSNYNKNSLEKTFTETEKIYKSIFEDPDGYGIGTLRDLNRKIILLYEEHYGFDSECKNDFLYSEQEKAEILNLLISLIILYFQSKLEFILKYCVAVIEKVFTDDIQKEFNEKFSIFNILMEESQGNQEEFENKTLRWLTSKYSYKLSPLFLMMDILLIIGDLFLKSNFDKEFLNDEMEELKNYKKNILISLYEIILKHDPIWEIEKVSEKLILFFSEIYNIEESPLVLDYSDKNEVFYLKKVLASTYDVLGDYSTANNILTELMSSWDNISIEEEIQLLIDIAYIHYHNKDYQNAIHFLEKGSRLEENIKTSMSIRAYTAQKQYISLISFLSNKKYTYNLGLQAYRYLILLKYNIKMSDQDIKNKILKLDKKTMYIEYFIVAHHLNYPIVGKCFNMVNNNYVSIVFIGGEKKIMCQLCNNFITEDFMSDIQINISVERQVKINYNRFQENEIDLKAVDRMVGSYRGLLKQEDEAEQRVKYVNPEYQISIRDMEHYGNVSSIESSGKRIKNLFLNDDIINNESIDKLIISRFSEVVRIPFGTLPLNKQEYLLNKFLIIYNDTKPLILLENKKNLMSNKQIILCGNPIDKCDQRKPTKRIYIDNYFKKISLLPATKEELNTIKEKVIGFPTTSYTEATFNKKNIKGINDVKILHIASHSFFNFREFLFPDTMNYFLDSTITTHSNVNTTEETIHAGVILSCFEQKKEDNSFLSINQEAILTLEEIKELSLINTDLVILSSCDSGLGYNGLVKAFFEAGTSTVIASLWEVSDNFTAEFMLQLYDELLKGILVSKALRNTKLKFIDLGYSAKFWSSFEVYGDDIIIFDNK